MIKRLLISLITVVTMLPIFAAQTFYYEGLRYEISDEGNKTCTLIDCTLTEEILTIPETVVYEGESYVVTAIGGLAFSDKDKLTSVKISKSVATIDFYAFYNCDKLVQILCDEDNKNYSSKNGVLFNKDYTVIIQYPKGKEGGYSIPRSVTTIGTGAFAACNFLTSIEIPNSVTTIGWSAFNKCISLVSIDIPNSVTIIDGMAFLNCTSLSSIDIPNSVTTIGENAFSNTSLTSLKLPNSLTTIESCAFSNCASLTSIELPNSLTTTGEGVFSSCTSLISAELPNSLTTIGGNAFSYCTSLSYVYIPNSVTTIGSLAFGGCTSLSSVDIPNSVTIIESSAFNGCTSLSYIKIPNSVTTIESMAFNNCTSLTSVEIPNSVATIGYEVFKRCPIINVYYNSENPIEADYSIFDWSCYNNGTLHVPSAAIEKVQATEPWRNFANIEAYEFDGIEAIVTDIDKDAPAEVYTLSGVKVASSLQALPAGIYVVTQNGKSHKIVAK